LGKGKITGCVDHPLQNGKFVVQKHLFVHACPGREFLLDYAKTLPFNLIGPYILHLCQDLSPFR
jgi:hypothetical protein